MDIQQQLIRHLLKTSGSELINELVLYMAEDSNVSGDSKEMSPEVLLYLMIILTYIRVHETQTFSLIQARQKLIGELPQKVRPALLALHKTTQGASVDDFLSQAETAISACDIVLRKADKKKDKSATSIQRQGLIEQLSTATDAALVLHLAVLLIFHSVTQTVLNASGRFVPQIITFLQPHLPAPTVELLTTLQGNIQ